MSNRSAGHQRCLDAMDLAGLEYRLVSHGPVRSAAEAAVARGVDVQDLVKTIVVRRGDDDFLFVLVPGDRAISWPKLRSLLDVSRMSLPDAQTAKEATGYERGTITPFGSLRDWPAIADERLAGRTIALGAGDHGVAAIVSADAVVGSLGGRWGDVTDPE